MTQLDLPFKHITTPVSSDTIDIHLTIRMTIQFSQKESNLRHPFTLHSQSKILDNEVKISSLDLTLAISVNTKV